MVSVRLVERIDGDWCAFVVGQEDVAVVGPTDDAALGRLVRQQMGKFGVDSVNLTPLDPSLSAEPAARLPGEMRLVGPDSSAPEFRWRAEEAGGR